MSERRFFITTAIDYVNSVPHIGTAYEKIGADALARFHRLKGDDTYFLMGNDEHSVNVLKRAQELGKDPKQYCDEMETQFTDVWKKLNVSYDDFIRTTEPRHHRSVQELFRRIRDNGREDIYKAKYTGWYCEGCERFYMEKDLEDGQCPNHKTKPSWIEEENYFFRLSAYRDRLLAFYEENPTFIMPEPRRNEIVNVVREGLEDISVSRGSFKWGIPVPDDPDQVVYVWFDALINYISGLGFPETDGKFDKYWPTATHIIGKDITRFHCVIWPAMLMAGGVAPPQRVFGHGFVYFRGEKMSKSLGTVVNPLDVVEQFGPDPLRYFLMAESSFGRDGNFTWELFIKRYNSDLANDLGNLLHRTVNMVGRYQEGTVLKSNAPEEPADADLREASRAARETLVSSLEGYADDIEFHNALGAIMTPVKMANKYIDDMAPWRLDKEGKKDRVASVLYNVLETLRVASVLLKPFIPQTAEKIWTSLGLEAKAFADLRLEDADWGRLPTDHKLPPPAPLFPRIDTKETEEKAVTEEPKAPKAEAAPAAQPEGVALIDFAEFQKVQLVVAAVLEAAAVPKTDKLLQLKIDVGEETRQIVAGIAQYYKPEELVGRKIVVVKNLKPAKLRGIESRGMLLAAKSAEGLSLITVDRDAPPGSSVS